MKFSTVSALFLATLVAAGEPDHCDGSGCSGVCYDGFCQVNGGYTFPCGGGTTCDGLDGKTCQAYGDQETQCPGGHSKRTPLASPGEPDHCDGSGCAGTCYDGFCQVNGGYTFPCGGGTTCDGLDGKTCQAYGDQETQCPGGHSKRELLASRGEPDHCDGSGCAGTCYDGFCQVNGGYTFPCGGGTTCDGLDGKTCQAYGDQETQCPGGHSKRYFRA